MRTFLLGVIAGLLIATCVVGGWHVFLRPGEILSPLNSHETVESPKPLLMYTFESLRKRSYDSTLSFSEVVKVTPQFTTWTFSFVSDGKTVKGIANIPSSQEKSATVSGFTTPIIILNRGFASHEEFYPGFGTERVAQVLAQNGYVTLAPSHLGFGGSDDPSSDVFEERFQTYTTVLNLISAADKLCSGQCTLGMWGHSNGGHISLAVLALSGRAIPTVLWNPVSKPFPYSILFYTDDFDDHGKALRAVLAKFEKTYDVEQFSVTNYLTWITAPLLLQQGEVDPLVPKRWSDQLFETLKAREEPSDAGKVTYKVYSGSDHNMLPRWNEAVSDLVTFFRNNLK